MKYSISDEVWKRIDGYGGKYEVSTNGRVRSSNTYPNAMKSFYCRNGYESVTLWDKGKKKNVLVHRLVAVAFISNPKEYTEINHIDEDKSNNRVTNLEWCTHIYNMNYGNVREKISNGNKGRKFTAEERARIGKDTSNRRWINNGDIEKYVYTEDVAVYLLCGWKKGRTKRRFRNVRKSKSHACGQNCG